MLKCFSLRYLITGKEKERLIGLKGEKLRSLYNRIKFNHNSLKWNLQSI